MIIDKEAIEKEVERIRRLKQYQPLSIEELTKIATKNLEENDPDLEMDALFLNKTEKKSAKVLLDKYLSDYSVETISDKNTLKQLVYLEILNNRLQTILNSHHENDKTVPLQLVDSIHKNINEINTLKDKLGLSVGKDQQGNSVYSIIEMYKRKFKKWREDNQASRFVPCKHCGKNTLLKIRTEAWEAEKHPFFKDKLLFNEELVRLYVEGTLTKDNLSKILGTSKDYIDWLVDKAWTSNPEYQKLQSEVNPSFRV
jgi:hypothetical protein